MVYTSGSTGPPKGALLSYGNMRVAAEGFVRRVGLDTQSVVLSYLPLCHIAEQAMTNIGPVFAGATACFGGGLPTLLEDLREVRPTYFSGVPRVWQKLQDEIVRRLTAAGRADALRTAVEAVRPLAFKPQGRWSEAERDSFAPHLQIMREARAAVGLERATACCHQRCKAPPAHRDGHLPACARVPALGTSTA